MNTLVLNQLIQLSTETDEVQTSFVESAYDERIYLATQSHHLETSHNRGNTHKGGTVFCCDNNGDCIWLFEQNDKELESFSFLIPMKNGMLIAAAKMVKTFEIGIKPEFHAKLFAIDKTGSVIGACILNECHYTGLSCGVEAGNNEFIVFGEIREEENSDKKGCAWKFDVNNFDNPEVLNLNSSLAGTFDFIEKTSDAFFSAGIGEQENTEVFNPVVRKMSIAGEIVWEKFIRTSKSDELVYSFVIDEEENLFIASETRVGGKKFLYVYKLDEAGNKVWQSKQESSKFGRSGVSLLLENKCCYVFSVQYGSPMNIYYHCFRDEDGDLLKVDTIGPLNTHNMPLVSHEKSMLLVAGNSIDSEDNMSNWISSMPIKNL